MGACNSQQYIVAVLDTINEILLFTDVFIVEIMVASVLNGY